MILTYFQRKIHSEVKELHLKRISASGKETEFVHSSLYIQISNTAMNALPCRQLGVKCYDKLCLSSAVAEIHAEGVSEVRNGKSGKHASPSQTFS